MPQLFYKGLIYHAFNAKEVELAYFTLEVLQFEANTFS